MNINDWRYDVSDDGTVTRGRMYRLHQDWDEWSHYWDSDTLVAVYDDERNYSSPTKGEDTERTEQAMAMARLYDQDVDAVLTRLARRIEGNWDARFIAVGLDRGVTLYACSYDGDPDNEWRNEIEALNYGDVYRCETERYVEHRDHMSSHWESDDDVCEQWYGDDKAEEGLRKMFPLTEFPAELFVGEVVGA